MIARTPSTDTRLALALALTALFAGAPHGPTAERDPVAAPAAAAPAPWLFEVRDPPRHRVVHEARRAEPAGAAYRPTRSAPEHGRLWAFKGLGAWIDAYDFALDPHRTVGMLKDAGVRTLFIQTGRTNTPSAVFPQAGRWLEAAHERGLEVVGWYLPYYRAVTVERDLNRTLAIARYRYKGHRFDGLGIDIEVRWRGTKVSSWNRRVAAHAARVREVLGPDYPIAAIPPPPLQMRVAPGHWAGFPWRALAREVDVMMLMSYWSDRVGCPKVRKHCAYGYTKLNVRLTRELMGRRDVLVHIIGGVADSIGPREVRDFVRGAKAAKADGASMYDVATTKPAWWRLLRPLAALG